MRQAGRYLPSYRKLREGHSLRDLFFTPELAAQVTLLPIELGVDAAILFSDITVVALALGFSLDFSEGPVITGHLQRRDLSLLEPIAETIRLVKPQLRVPLIGFCGGPFTVASYINGDPALLDPITEVTIEYLHMQEEAGVDAIQIFDSWADRLSPEEFQRFCMPYLKRLIDAVHVPVILFMRGATMRIPELVQLGPDAISFDWGAPLATLRPKVPMAIQGNLNPNLLFEPLPTIAQKTRELLDSLRGDPGFIVNLGHGVKPNTPVEAVRCLIDTVRSYK
jgi:uroporphyrinogen decarboxylase